MHARVSDFHNAIPTAIRPMILRCDILASEDPKLYKDLLIELWVVFRPKDPLLWLDLKKLTDLIWESMRISRIKPELINAGRKKALVSLLLSTTNERVYDFNPSGNVMQAEELALAWFSDPTKKEQVSALLKKFGYSEDTIDAIAFKEESHIFTTLDKMQVTNAVQQHQARRVLEEGCDTSRLLESNNDNKKQIQTRRARNGTRK